MRTLGVAVLLVLAALSPVALSPAAAQPSTDPENWSAVVDEARGQTVYFHHWGGDPRINAYIDWAGGRIEALHGVRLVSVRLADTAEAVSRVLAERSAGTVAGGAVDLLWINGENFTAMRGAGLLLGPWAESLPNFALTAPDANPAVRVDFTAPTDGFEAPWGAAQLVFFADHAVTPDPPRSAAALLAWAADNPGRFAYPQPPNYLGSTFLKQILLEVIADPAALSAPAAEAPDGFAATTAPLWDYLDALHPHLWRRSRAYPADGLALRRLVNDSELEIGFAFGAAEPAGAVANGELPPGTQTFMFDAGMIGNVNFLAIPFNAANAAGAMVVANFMLSPEAQARKQDPRYWGGGSVLAMDALSAADRARFEALDLGAATLPPSQRAPISPEPHPSWTERLEAEWRKRYGAD